MARRPFRQAQGRPTLVVFLGGLGSSPVEGMVGGARRAAALDSVEAALHSGSFTGAVLVTDDPAWAADMAGLTLSACPDGSARITLTIARPGAWLQRGGGAVPVSRSDGLPG